MVHSRADVYEAPSPSPAQHSTVGYRLGRLGTLKIHKRLGNGAGELSETLPKARL